MGKLIKTMKDLWGSMKELGDELSELGMASPVPPPPPLPPWVETQRRVNKWIGIEHFPCSKCDCIILYATAEIVFYDKETRKRFMCVDYFTMAAPEDFKAQFLLLHP